MIRIPCPHCGPRDEHEFTWGGEADIDRPADPKLTTDKDWADYQFFRDNQRGPVRERWCHTYGCGEWVNLERDTVTHKVLTVDPVADPAIPQGGD